VQLLGDAMSAGYKESLWQLAEGRRGKATAGPLLHLLGRAEEEGRGEAQAETYKTLSQVSP
jgi:hypothetical protein